MFSQQQLPLEPAFPLISDQRRTMPASSSQVLTLAQRQSRVAAFKAAISDPDRRADAQARLPDPAWIKDVLKAVVEPIAEDDHLGLFQGLIPNQDWLHLRANHCGGMVLPLWREVRSACRRAV